MIHKGLNTNTNLYRSLGGSKTTINVQLIVISMAVFAVVLNLYFGLTVVTEKMIQVASITPIFG